MNEKHTLWWDAATASICYIDQTRLPGHCSIVKCTTIEQLVLALQRLEIRGAPALGVAGAFGVVLAAMTCTEKTPDAFMKDVRRSAELLAKTRPTAINLAWGINRVLAAMAHAADVDAARVLAAAEAEAIGREDEESCHAIGEYGATLLPDQCTVLTHCNAGALACSSWGTALGVIRSAVVQGKNVKVIACETRPLMQGARLTAWELARDGIDVTVITESTAAYMMRRGEIDRVIVGADRITRDAVFNKIGTYMHAVCARHHDIPFYVAAPLSTFDAEKTEGDVIIEERGRAEITTMGDRVVVPDTVPVKNYAFDATPMELVTVVITDKGLLIPPIDVGLLLSRKSAK